MTRLASIAIALCIGCGDDTTAVIDSSPGGGEPAIDGPGVDGPTVDAAIGATCGTAQCTATQECCVGAGGSSCVDLGTCQSVAFACDGPEDCEANQVCCFAGGGGGAGTAGAECKAANSCPTSACHSNDDCGGATPMCCTVAQTQYSMCRAQCQ